jgi:hypothetical protein
MVACNNGKESRDATSEQKMKRFILWVTVQVASLNSDPLRS